MPENAGLYIHVPFCRGGKCPYCDFYSLPLREDLAQAYIKAVKRASAFWSESARGKTFDSVYFGGGTPSLLGQGLARMLEFIREDFSVTKDAEITLEANPSADMSGLFGSLREAGFNRLSLGLQSASPGELAALGRRHSPQDAARAVGDAKAAGFENISLDLMLATPGQTIESLGASMNFAASLEPSHISAYLLKVEPGTRFYDNRAALDLPDDDAQAEFYLEACEGLEGRGFLQYEISNFAKPGRESRHNLKYWNCDEYLGLGPGAYSFFDSARFHYESSLENFIGGAGTACDGAGGDIEEYIMLRLRLNAGLRSEALAGRFGAGFEMFDAPTLSSLRGAGYIDCDKNAICLTRKGFLVSNSVISTLLYKKPPTADTRPAG